MSELIKDGGPAYPQTNDAWFGSDGNTPCPSGMSLRDYFAAKAMQGDWASQSAQTGEFVNSTPQEYFESRAKTYYRAADAMIAARHKKENT